MTQEPKNSGARVFTPRKVNDEGPLATHKLEINPRAVIHPTHPNDMPKVFEQIPFMLTQVNDGGSGHQIVKLSGQELTNITDWVGTLRTTRPACRLAPQMGFQWQETTPDLLDFLQTNFKLHKRRLSSDSDAGHYLTNLAAMNAFHDVLEFLKKAPTLPTS